MKITFWKALLLSSFIISFSSCKKENDKEMKRQIEEPVVSVTPQDERNWEPIPEQYIVTYKETSSNQTGEGGNSESFVTKSLEEQKINVPNIQKIFEGHLKGFVAKLNKEQLEQLKKDPKVAYIEPDRYVAISIPKAQIINLSYQPIPWGVKRVGYADGTGKTAWIIDSGIDLNHPDLNVDVARSKSFLEGKTPDDESGHGTHVAGTIAAKNNAFGVVGVAPNAKVVSLRVLDEKGSGTLSGVIAALDYVVLHARAGDVVNMSIGGSSSPTLDKKVLNASKKGIFFAIAAGNESADAVEMSPAGVNGDNIFTVSSMKNTDEWSSFSNYGAPVDYCAPGESIFSTYKNGTYASLSGTSMATPHVAGLLLIKGKNIISDGFVKGDPDGKPDPIAHK